MSKVVVFGATGYAGGNIAEELLRRGHEVIGVARNVSELEDGVRAQAGSIHDAELVEAVTEGADHVVVALPARALEEGGPKLIDALPKLMDAAVTSSACLSFVGGAGSLRVSENGPALVDSPDFPADFRGEAHDHGAVLDALRASEQELDWFYVSPAATFGAWNAGERTGKFRIGGDVLLVDEAGNSAISGADYAIAFVDEIERGEHRRERFTVAY